MSPAERALRIRLRDSLLEYAPRCLRIRTKSGKVQPFALNKAQLYIHARLEEQKKRLGRVRAIVLKGRQQGCSTYVGARFFHITTHRTGFRTFILTHEAESTGALFDMTKRYYEHLPALLKPSSRFDNANELSFGKLDSGYKLGTAGNKAVGRGNTLQLFHGSEVGLWPNAHEIAAGVLQAVADEDGTEVVLESTAKGVGNFFHQQWKKAEAGLSEYIPIFVPWFWQDEYRKPAPPDFQLSTDPDELGETEVDYATAYGLDADQMYWRRLKISDLGETKFREEYPGNAAEAFQMATTNGLISSRLIMRARKNSVEPVGSLVFGYDPAHQGGDRHALAKRRGRKVLSVGGKVGMNAVESANYLQAEIDRDRPVKCFIDATGGYGAGVYDILCERGYGPEGRKIVVPVNFGASPRRPLRYSPTTGEELPGPLNRRAEIWMDSLAWLEDEAGVDLPDQDDIQADACSTGYDHDSKNRLQLWSKQKMRGMGIPSPDLWDAIALTFSEPVVEKQAPVRILRPRSPNAWAGGR